MCRQSRSRGGHHNRAAVESRADDCVTPDEMLGRIKRGLAENSARFHPKVIVYEGMAGWGAMYSRLVEGLHRLGWRRAASRYAPGATVCGAGMQMPLR
jgi:hypothetical protein